MTAGTQPYQRGAVERRRRRVWSGTLLDERESDMSVLVSGTAAGDQAIG